MDDPARMPGLMTKLEPLLIRLEELLLRLDLGDDGKDDKVTDQEVETPTKSDADTVGMREKDDMVVIHQ